MRRIEIWYKKGVRNKLTTTREFTNSVLKIVNVQPGLNRINVRIKQLLRSLNFVYNDKMKCGDSTHLKIFHLTCLFANI